MDTIITLRMRQKPRNGLPGFLSLGGIERLDRAWLVCVLGVGCTSFVFAREKSAKRTIPSLCFSANRNGFLLSSAKAG